MDDGAPRDEAAPSEAGATFDTAEDLAPILTKGLMGMLVPAVARIDESVEDVQQSQKNLHAQIDALEAILQQYEEHEDIPVELESYAKRLANARRKVLAANTLLKTVQDRTTRLHTSITKATKRRQTQLDSPAGKRP